MKKIILMLAIGVSFAACKQKENSDKNLVPLSSPYNAQGDTAKINNGIKKDSVVTVTTTTITKTPVDHNSSSKQKSSANGVAPVQSAATNSAGTTTNSGSVSNAQPAPKKKGWSKAAKGTAIGAGAGAVTGAVIGKNVKGAVIGGVVGAAGGYIIGRSQDKKDGRVKKDSL